MIKKNNLGIFIDSSMIILLPLLKAYSLIGELFHEIIGTMMFAIFIIYQILNRRRYGTLFKGRYTITRIFQTVINLTLLILMILQPLSRILMSKHLYAFLPVLPISAYVRGNTHGYCILEFCAYMHSCRI